jgi:hypothetical protein
MKVVNNNNGTFTITKEIKLSEEQMNTLKTIVDQGYGEIRRSSPLKQDICYELEAGGFVDDGDGMAWNLTFYPTELGKQIISSIK